MNGIRIFERRHRLFCPSEVAPHPTPLPVKNGEREQSVPAAQTSAHAQVAPDVAVAPGAQRLHPGYEALRDKIIVEL
jgi:hypothetical protein